MTFSLTFRVPGIYRCISWWCLHFTLAKLASLFSPYFLMTWLLVGSTKRGILQEFMNEHPTSDFKDQTIHVAYPMTFFPRNHRMCSFLWKGQIVVVRPVQEVQQQVNEGHQKSGGLLIRAVRKKSVLMRFGWICRGQRQHFDVFAIGVVCWANVFLPFSVSSLNLCHLELGHPSLQRCHFCRIVWRPFALASKALASCTLAGIPSA